MTRRAQRSPSLRSCCGIAEFGSRVVVWGRDLHAECLDLSFVHYFLFCATGRWFNPVQARVFEQLWIATGYPDARLWCNRVAGYLGSARVDPALALCAALAATNSRTYGFGAMNEAFELQTEIPEPMEDRKEWLAQQLLHRRKLLGYGRPVAGSDERLTSAYRILAEHALQAGPALKRAYWLSQQLAALKGIQMNISAVWAAIALDWGMSAEEYRAFMLLLFSPGYIAVYTDQRRREPLSFLNGYQSTSSARIKRERPRSEQPGPLDPLNQEKLG